MAKEKECRISYKEGDVLLRDDFDGCVRLWSGAGRYTNHILIPEDEVECFKQVVREWLDDERGEDDG